METEGYRDFIPDRFRFSHGYALYLHDCMVQMLVEGEATDLFQTQIDFRTPEHATDFGDEPSGFILDWLAERGYSEELGEALLKSTFPAIMSDMCHFLFEALSCVRKGKLTVAYALLRKPIRENLHYLEWMLADPEGMLDTFYTAPSARLAFSTLGSNPARVVDVIQRAINRTAHAQIHDAQRLYDLRYGRQASDSYDVYCNQAMHLITTKSGLETEQMNFNFIFSGDEARRSQWAHLYTTLPQMLFYAVDVCESLRMIAGKGVAPDLRAVSIHRAAGRVLWLNETTGMFDATPSGLGLFQCPACSASSPGTEQLFRELYFDRSAHCPSCGAAMGLEWLAGDA